MACASILEGLEAEQLPEVQHEFLSVCYFFDLQNGDADAHFPYETSCRSNPKSSPSDRKAFLMNRQLSKSG
jgi:hypothetical protein